LCCVVRSGRFDLELPPEFVPYNGDGEVESFQLVDAEEALRSIQTNLEKCERTGRARYGSLTAIYDRKR
jgi:hypothetical protein